MNFVATQRRDTSLTFLRFSWFSSIRTKMLMFAVLATLLPSLTTVWISYIENKRALQAKASEELLGVSAQALREVDLWTKELRLDLLVFSSSYEVTENLERIPLVNGEPVHSGIYFKRLTDFLNSVRDRFPDYSELMVLDPHGHVVATSASQPRPVPLASDWASSLTRNDWALGTPYWDSVGAHPEILVSVSIESGGERVGRAGRGGGGIRLVGALASRVNLRTVADTLRRFAPGETGQIYLMTRTGQLIVSSQGSSRTRAAPSSSPVSLVTLLWAARASSRRWTGSSCLRFRRPKRSNRSRVCATSPSASCSCCSPSSELSHIC